MKRIALPLLLLALAACGGSRPYTFSGGDPGGGPIPGPPAPATAFVYEDPLDTSGWRLVRNAASTPERLVLDLMPPAGGSGMGVTLEISVPAAIAAWDEAGPAPGCPYQGTLVQRFSRNGGTLRLLLSQRPPIPPASYGAGPVATLALRKAAGAPLGPVSMTFANAAHLAAPLVSPETVVPAAGVLKIQ